MNYNQVSRPDELEELQKLRYDFQKLLEADAKIRSSLSENRSLHKEIMNVKNSETIYRLVGSVLVKKEKKESEREIKRKIEYLEGEMKRVEVNL